MTSGVIAASYVATTPPSYIDFLTSGAYIPAAGETSVDVLVVGGGGGGGSTNSNNGNGAGGAGGVRWVTGVSVTPGVPVYAYVGAGGAGTPAGNIASGSSGASSTFGTVTALGGGFGNGELISSSGGAGGSGGSGGGGGTSNGGYVGPGGTGTAGQGNNGGGGQGSPTVSGRVGGGGGGAGAAASAGTSVVGANGGAGVDMSANVGTSYGVAGWFGGGGGGGGHSNGGAAGQGGGGKGGGDNNGISHGGDGVANTGGGGGGAQQGSGGGNGGSGFVVVRGLGVKAAYPSAVLADTPLAYYRLGESSGTTASDVSGNARDATYAGPVTLGTTGLLAGDSNTAATFGGGTGTNKARVNIPSAAWMSGIKGFDAVVKLNATGGGSVVDSDDDGSQRNWQFNFTGTNTPQLVWWTSAGGGPNFLNPTNTNSVGTTYHIAAMLDGTGTWRLYINGAVVATSSAGTSLRAPGAAGIRLGCHNNSLQATPFQGVIDEVAIYGTGLSTARVLAHYNASI